MHKLITLSLMAAGLSAHAANVVIDDFAGGPHFANLTSFAPPEIATASFAYGGAIGGIRDAAVWSTTQGSFAAGWAFSYGGYASFVGRGEGGLVWDGVAGIADANADNRIDANELDYGLALDLSDCTSGEIYVAALADLTTAVLKIAIATDASNYHIYEIPLTGPTSQYNAYEADLDSPTTVVGTVDWANVGAIAAFVDASNFDNLDVLMNSLYIACPDGGWTLGLMGLGLLCLPALRRFVR